MQKVNFEKEWEFIITETHNRKLGKTNLIKREVLFSMQVLLSKAEAKNYLSLKKFYYKKLIEK